MYTQVVGRLSASCHVHLDLRRTICMEVRAVDHSIIVSQIMYGLCQPGPLRLYAALSSCGMHATGVDRIQVHHRRKAASYIKFADVTKSFYHLGITHLRVHNVTWQQEQDSPEPYQARKVHTPQHVSLIRYISCRVLLQAAMLKHLIWRLQHRQHFASSQI